MTTVLLYFIQVIICSGILYGYYFAVLRNKRFHQYNRYYLLLSCIISPLIPFLHIPVYFTAGPKEPLVLLEKLNSFSIPLKSMTSLNLENPVGAELFTWQNLFLVVYITAASLVVMKLLISISRINRLSRKYPAQKIDNIYFINTAEAGTPFSFFKRLFWNKKIELASETGQQVFRHELFHIEQKHSYDIVFIEMFTAVFWINPFFHFIKKELKVIHEFLADRFAVKENNKWDYAELLLMHVLGTPHKRLTNPFFHNQIKRRIAMITSSTKTNYQYLRKLLVLPVAAVIAGLFAFSYSVKEKKYIGKAGTLSIEKILTGDTTSKPIHMENVRISVEGRDKDTSKPLKMEQALIVIDGKLQPGMTTQMLNDKIKSEDIKAINVVKGDVAMKRYGEKGKNGAIEIFTKPGYTVVDDVALPDSSSFPGANGQEIMVIIHDDSTPVIKQHIKLKDFKTMVPEDQVGSMNVYTGKDAIDTYGPDAKNGVIEIFTKKFKASREYKTVLDTIPVKPNSEDNMIFEKVEIEPSFPGGESAWRQFLEKNLNAGTPAKNNAPAGTYTVFVQFIVDKEGNIKDLKALTNFGYGMEQEVMRVIRLSKWKPAIQNGRIVSAYKKQPITFVIEVQ